MTESKDENSDSNSSSKVLFTNLAKLKQQQKEQQHQQKVQKQNDIVGNIMDNMNKQHNQLQAFNNSVLNKDAKQSLANNSNKHIYIMESFLHRILICSFSWLDEQGTI